ncbi:MAG: hypothetical protein HUU08_04370 [Candidatus Brocadia sp.]|nr:hypothetical protein [Candidatus Brocadia sp.]
MHSRFFVNLVNLVGQGIAHQIIDNVNKMFGGRCPALLLVAECPMNKSFGQKLLRGLTAPIRPDQQQIRSSHDNMLARSCQGIMFRNIFVTILGNLMGEDYSLAQKDKAYRCLDLLLEYHHRLPRRIPWRNLSSLSPHIGNYIIPAIQGFFVIKQ